MSYTVSVPKRDNQIKPYQVPVECAAPGVKTESTEENQIEPIVLGSRRAGQMHLSDSSI
jgi:hypothetical protein